MLLSFVVKFVQYLSCEKNENKQKEAGLAHLEKTFENSFTLKFTQQHVCPGQILSYLVLFIRAKFCRIRVKFWLIYVLLCFHKILFCIFHVLYLKRPKLNQKEIVVVPFLFKKINVAHSDRRTHSTLLYLLSLYLGITASHAV